MHPHYFPLVTRETTSPPKKQFQVHRGRESALVWQPRHSSGHYGPNYIRKRTCETDHRSTAAPPILTSWCHDWPRAGGDPTVAGEFAFRGDWLAKQRTAAPWL